MSVDPQRLRAAQKKVESDPYDMESWQLIVKDAQNNKIDASRDTFEKIVTLFPTSGRFWKVYIEQEMRSRNFENVEKLFTRSLMKVLSIELWKIYLLYVKETKASLSNYKEKMAQAYDFAIDKIGLDIASYPIWNEYVKFLKAVEAVGSYAENQKITAIRKVYQKGIVNPMINIEQFWKDYVAFEQSVNPILAERMTGERSRDYMNARRVAKEYEACTRGLNKTAPCIPPTGTAEELKQLELWQKYISWERSNPLRVEDPPLIARRVMFAYEQSLLCMGHHPNVWYEAACFLQDSSKQMQDKGDVDQSKMFQDQASALFERATTGILCKSMLLHFAYADFEEQQRRTEKVHQIYKKFLEIQDIDPTLCYIQYMKFCRRTEGTLPARTIFKKAREDPRSTHQIYVASALMEYYCTKDKKIAANVFELGFKKHKGNENYIMAYIDYLSHLNEDNNTRVLFERALTSGALKPEQQIEIWHKFLQFEAQIGDMSSIVKVEKRRAVALAQVSDSPTSETAQLIDRYKFLDLYPGQPDELRLLGYQIQSSSLPGANLSMNPLGVAPTPMANGASAPQTAIVQDSDKMKRPDVAQMIPFKPKHNWIPGEHRIPGGEFPLPPAAAEVCQSLPPPSSFQGPFVVVDRLLEVFARIKLPEEFSVPSLPENGHHPRLFDTARSTNWSADNLADKDRSKRNRDSDDEDDDQKNSAPVNDIYRKRQKKKIM